MQVGSIELELLLNRTNFDATLRAAEKDAERFRTNANWKVEPEVNQKPVEMLSKSLDTGKAHLDNLNRYLKANPVTLQVDLSQLERVHDLMGMSGTVSVTAEVKGSKQSGGNSDCCDQLERTIASNFSGVKDLLKEIAGNTKPKGIIGKTASTLFEGAVFGTTQAATRSLGEGISRGLERYFKTDFNRQGQAFGLGTGRNVSKANRIVDVASRELLGMPNGIRDLRKLAVNPAQKAFNNFIDPKFYREIENLVVYANQKNSNPREQEINQRLLDEARGKIQSRFIAQVEEDVVAITRAMITLASHPLRVRKRIKLGESAQQANAQEQLFRPEYEAKGVQERIAQSDSILHFVGGVAPNESKPGAPAVGTSHSMAAAMQAIFPDAFVDVTTPHNTVDPEQIKQGLYHQIVREQILPWLRSNKDTASSVMGDEAYSNLTNNLGQLHPLDAILQQNVDRGYNPDSIRLATKALASAQAFPEKDITLASASGGGFIVEEAIAILNEMAKRYPELQSAVKRVKSFAIGTPIAGLTQTSRSGDADLDLATYQAYLGSQDKVGKAMFGSKPGELQEDLGLPLGILNPDLNLQTVIQDWGLDHKVGEMIADLGKPISKFVVLLADFMNGNNQLTDGDAKGIVDLFNKAQNLKLGESFEDYVAEVTEIISGIAEVNRKIGGQIDVGSLRQFSSKLRKLPELDPETAAQIPDLLTGTLSEGLGINNIQGLGRRNQPGKQALSAVTISNLIKDIVNQISKARGAEAIFPEAEFDALDPNIADISTIEAQLGKSALELNLPVGDSGSLVQLWKKQPPEQAPVRGYQAEFKELWQQVLAEVQKIVELDPSQKDRLFAEDGSLQHGNFLWDAAGIATQYKQPTYAEMHQQKSTKEFNTPVEQQYEKALMAFFALYEKEAEIYKKDYLEAIKQEKEAYLNGDPEAATRLQDILGKSKFSSIADITKRAKVATNKGIAKKEILGSNTDYDLFSDFVNKFVQALSQYEAGDRQDPGIFQNLAKESFGINPQIDYLLAQATTGTGRIPDSVKAEDIKPDTTIALPSVKSVIEGIFEDLLKQGITDLKTASDSITLESLNLDGINAILEQMIAGLEVEGVDPAQAQTTIIPKAKTPLNKDKYLPTLEVDDNPFVTPERSQLGDNNPLTNLHQNTNVKLDVIIDLLSGESLITPDPPSPQQEVNPPRQLELIIDPVPAAEAESKLALQEPLQTGLEATSNIVKSFVNGVIENFDGLHREAQKWEKAFLDLAPGQAGHLAKKATQYTAVPIAATFAAQGIPGIEQAINLVHGLADLGLHDLAQGVADGVMDSISRTMPDVFGNVMDALGNAPIVGDYFNQARQIPQAIAESSSDYLIGNAGRTVADIGVGSGIIKGGKDAYDALGNRLNPKRLDAKDQELLDRVKDHTSVEYQTTPNSPEITAELETLKLEAGFQELEQAASATARKLEQLFSVEGLRRLAPMVDIPTTSLTPEGKPIKSANKQDIANLIARMSSDDDLAGAIANASPQMFLKQFQGQGKIKPEIDPQAFNHLKRYWEKALSEINATPLEILDPENAMTTLEGFSRGYVNLLNDKELTGSQRESAGNFHGQTSELKSALQAYSKFGNIQDLEEKFTKGAVNAERHWGNTTADILKNFRILAAEAKDKGYDIQRFISEGSPGPTANIRENYEKTADSVEEDLEQIAQTAKRNGEAVEQAFDLSDFEANFNPQIAQELKENQEYLLYSARAKNIPNLSGEEKRQGYFDHESKTADMSLDNRMFVPGSYSHRLDQKLSEHPLYKRRQEFYDENYKDQSFTLEPHIAFSQDYLEKILEVGYQPGIRDYNLKTKGGYDAGLARKYTEDKIRPEYADPSLSPIYGALLPKKVDNDWADYIESIGGYGGNSPVLMKLRPSILEKSTLTVGDSANRSNLYPATSPRQNKQMFEETVRSGNPYLEFQYWGKDRSSSIIDELIFPKTKPTDEQKNLALEKNIPISWKELDMSDPTRLPEYKNKNNHPELRTLRFASENPLSELENRFSIPADKTQKHWAKTAKEILKQFEILASEAEDKGYDIQRFISEGSPGPTEKIRKHWQTTEKALAKNIEQIAQKSKMAGSAIEQLFSANPELVNEFEKIVKQTEELRSVLDFSPEHPDFVLDLVVNDINLEKQISTSIANALNNAEAIASTQFPSVEKVRGEESTGIRVGIPQDVIEELIAGKDPLITLQEDRQGSYLVDPDTNTLRVDPRKDIGQFNVGRLQALFDNTGFNPDDRNYANNVKPAGVRLVDGKYQLTQKGSINFVHNKPQTSDSGEQIIQRPPVAPVIEQINSLPNFDNQYQEYLSNLQRITIPAPIIPEIPKIATPVIPASITTPDPWDSVNPPQTATYSSFDSLNQEMADYSAQVAEIIREHSNLPVSQVNNLGERLAQLKQVLTQDFEDTASAIANISQQQIGLDATKALTNLNQATADSEDIQSSDSLDTTTASSAPTDLEDSVSRLQSGSLNLSAIWSDLVATSVDWAKSMQSGGDPLGVLEDVYGSYAATIDSLPNTADIFGGIGEFIDEMSQASPVFGKMVGFVKDLGISVLGILGFSELNDVIVSGFSSLIEYGREFRKFDLAMMAAGKNGNQVFESLYATSQKYGTSLKESMAGYTQLTLSTVGTDKEATVDAIFPGFQKAFASRQSNPEQINRGYVAIEQLLGKSSAGSEELRQQLSEALPGSFAIAAQAMGMDMQEFTASLKESLIPADELLTRMAAFYDIDSEILLEISAGSFEAELARITNNLDYLKTTLAQLIIPPLTPALQTVNAILTVVAHNSELIAVILSGIVVGAVWQWVKSMTAVASVTRLNIIAMKLLGMEAKFAAIAIRGIAGASTMTKSLILMRNSIALAGNAAKAMWAAFAPSAAVMAGLYLAFKYITAGADETKAAAKVAKTLRKETEKTADPVKYQRSFAADTGLGRVGQNFKDSFTTWEGFKNVAIPFAGSLERRNNDVNAQKIRSSIKDSEYINRSIQKEIASTDFPEMKSNLSKNRGLQSYLNAQRLVAIDNSDYGALAKIEEQRAALKQKQEKLLAPVTEKITSASRNLEQLKTQKQFLAENFDKKNITQEGYNKALDKINAEINITLSSKETYEAILKGVTTNIEAEFRNIQEEFENKTWKIEGTLTQNTLDDINAKLAGEISPLELETRTPLRKLESARETADGATVQADKLKASLLNQEASYKQNALFSLQLLKPEDYPSGSLDGYDFNTIFEQKLPEILNLSPEKFIKPVSEEASQEEIILAQFLTSLGLYSQKASEATEANKNAAEAANDYAGQLKKNAADYRDFGNSLRDFARSQEDNQIERQRFAEDFPEQVAQVQQNIAQSAQDFKDKYDDFITGLERNILETQLEIEQLEKQIGDRKIDNKLLKQFTPGSSGLGLDIGKLYGEYLKGIQPDSIPEQNLSRLDTEEQLLDLSRQIRDIGKERQTLEQERLTQMRDLKRQQEDFNLQQKRTWEDSLDQWYEINLQAEELGVTLNLTGEQISKQGTGLIESIYLLAENIKSAASNLTVNTTAASNGSGIINALRRAIIGNESSGNFKAVNSTTGALGYGQVLPENVPSWTQEALGKSLTPDEFFNDSLAQVEVINYKLNEFYQKELLKTGGDSELAIRRVASTWYSGEADRYNDTTPVTVGGKKNPTRAEYTADILKRVKADVELNTPIAVPNAPVVSSASTSLPAPPSIASLMPPMPSMSALPTLPTLPTPPTPPTSVPTFSTSAPTLSTPEVTEKAATLESLYAEKQKRQDELKLEDQANALFNLINDAAAKDFEVQDYFRNLKQGLGDRDYETLRSHQEQKGYLTKEEEVNFAGLDVERTYRGKIFEIENQQRELQRTLQTYQDLVKEGGILDQAINAGVEGAQEQKDKAQEAIKTLESILASNYGYQVQLEVDLIPAVNTAEINKALELDFQQRADELGMKTETLDARKSLAPSFIHDLAYNNPTRKLGKEQLELDYDQKLQGLDKYKDKNGEITQQYREMKKALDELNQVKLDALYLQTSELANIFDEVLQPALNGLLDDFIDTSVRASDAWRNFATSILNSLAQILMAFAKNELLRLLFKDSGKEGDFGKKTNEAAGVDWGTILGGATQQLFPKTSSGVDISGKTKQKSGLNWGEELGIGVESSGNYFSKKKEAAEFSSFTDWEEYLTPLSGVDISGKTKQKSGLNWGDALGVGAGFAASAINQNRGQVATAPTGGGFDWSQLIGAASSFIPLIFSEGGDTEAMVIPYANQGLDTKDIALAKGLNEAIRKENHPDAFPAVLHKGEIVHSDLTGDAQLARRLKNTGEWDRMKNTGYQSSKVENFRYGSEGMGGFRSAGATVVNNYNSSVNVSAKDADSFRATDSQIARRQRLLQERSKR
jgi:tape measure domain-containing protein